MDPLPNADLAVIEIDKLTRYCLDPSHPDGRHKARVFKAALGIELSNHADLLQAIRNGILTHAAVPTGQTAHGDLWRVDIQITGPTGTATLRTGWIFERGQNVPRLPTAFVLAAG